MPNQQAIDCLLTNCGDSEADYLEFNSGMQDQSR